MADKKRVVVTGATGLIGKALCKALQADGYDVVVFARDPEQARRVVPGAVDYVSWSASSESGPWTAHIDGAWGVVNLAGTPVAGKRWTEQRKREIRDSRVSGTRGIVAAIAASAHKPRVLVNASAIGYYGPRDDTPLDENAPAGHDFLAGVVADWEAEARKAENAGVRVVMVRTGIVLDKNEGALAQLKLPYQFFVGGPVLPGTQWLSWIHHDDEVGIMMLALRDERAHGPINATAPAPRTNRDFSHTLGKVLGRPSLVPVPGFALKLLFGEFADTLTTGQRVLPAKAEELGYRFQYDSSEAALRQIFS